MQSKQNKKKENRSKAEKVKKGNKLFDHLNKQDTFSTSRHSKQSYSSHKRK